MIDILLTNDDGYQAHGFYPLLQALSRDYSVAVVAPAEQTSWVGKSVSSRTNLEVKKTKLHEFEIYTIKGTPADCIQVGLYNVLQEKPKLVVSGINDGANTGHGRLLSSGTIGAAMEAAIDGVFAVTSSLCLPDAIRFAKDYHDAKNLALFEESAKITLKIINIVMKEQFDKDTDFLSVNIPYGATIQSDFAITRPHREQYGQLFHVQGDVLTHKTPSLDFKDLVEGTDLKAISEGRVSITPVNLDLASKDSIERFNKFIGKNW